MSDNEAFKDQVAAAARNGDLEDLIESDGEATLAALGEIKRDVEAQMVIRKADLSLVQNECHAEGPSGKQRWFTAKAEYEVWRGGAVAFLNHLTTAHGATKAAVIAQRVHGHNNKPTPSKPGSARAKLLDVVEYLLDSLEDLREKHDGMPVAADIVVLLDEPCVVTADEVVESLRSAVQS